MQVQEVINVRQKAAVLQILWLAALSGVQASAQTGSLQGTILDGDRQPVADVRIVVEKLPGSGSASGGIRIAGVSGSGRRFELRSSRRGEFMKVGIQPGTYRITASKAGYPEVQVEHAVTLGGPTVLPDIVLALGSSQTRATIPSAPAAEPPQSALSAATGAGVGGTRTAAKFVVDPNDIDKLAANLRRRMDATSELKERLARSQVAVMNFELLDIATPSVAANVAEDLSTALINNGFQVVERGQLDKALKELKIQDSGLVDPQTAKRLGQVVGCDTLTLGSISDRGQFVVINARLVDTATGKSLAAERVEMRKIPMTQ